MKVNFMSVMRQFFLGSPITLTCEVNCEIRLSLRPENAANSMLFSSS